MTATSIHYFKYDRSEHWRIEAELERQDERGWWLRGHEGARVWKGDEVANVEKAGFVALVPRDDWWAAFWNFDRTGPWELYIDIATPATWTDGELQLVDLDLDVVRSWDGAVQLLDEDEFELHAGMYGYPEEIRDRASATAAQLVERVRAGEPPFDVFDAGGRLA